MPLSVDPTDTLWPELSSTQRRTRAVGWWGSGEVVRHVALLRAHSTPDDDQGTAGAEGQQLRGEGQLL